MLRHDRMCLGRTPRLPRLKRVAWAAMCLLLAGPLSACRGTDLSDPLAIGSPDAPRYRATGERLPTFSGIDPSLRGWTKVDDLLWVEARHAEAYQRGEVFDGERYVPFAEAIDLSVRAEEGFVLRTDHVQLRTNAAWQHAVDLAREAEAHVTRVMHRWGEPLDLRLPRDPLPVTVMATRAEFEARLRGAAHAPMGWGAFYDSGSGSVNVCVEPARVGALPLLADLRHEMTHQLVDLSRPPAMRGDAFGPGWFWLWEGLAIYSEHFGDAAGSDVSAARFRRFHRRWATRQWAPLPDLVQLDASRFEGRHYDQTGVWMRWLMGASDPARPARILRAAGELLHGRSRPSLESTLGAPIHRLEAAWHADVRARFGPPGQGG